MYTEIYFLTSGLVFGLSAGLSPGPLQMLVISETLKHGLGSGLKVAIAPLLTDLPIILVTLFLISKLSNINIALGCISILGGGYLAYLASESFRFKGKVSETVTEKPKSIQKGMIANFLNPSPYLFWFSIGAPTVIKASEISIWAVISFVAALYILLVGGKAALAVIVVKSGQYLKSKAYVMTMRFLGLILFAFACHYLLKGIRLLDLF